MKKFKKVLAVAAALMLTVSLAAGCGKQEKEEGGEETHKIGFVLYGTDDNLGAAVYSYLNYAAEALGNVELVWDLGAYDVDGQISSTQNLIAAGCEGILVLPMVDDTVQQMSDLCAQEEVYFSLMFRDITDPDIREDVYNNEYFLGYVREDDQSAAKEMVKAMADAGVTNMGVQLMASGNALSARNDGMYEGAEEYGITVEAEFPVTSSGDVSGNNTYIQNVLDSYPDVNGIFLTTASLGLGEGAANLLGGVSEPGSVKLASFDVFDGMKEAFDSGVLACAAGGINTDALFSFMVLYNAVDGNRLSDDIVELYQNFLIVTNAEECEAFEKYVGDTEYQIYTDDQIKDLAVRYNPEVTLDDYKELMEQFSIDWLIENEH